MSYCDIKHIRVQRDRFIPYEETTGHAANDVTVPLWLVAFTPRCQTGGVHLTVTDRPAWEETKPEVQSSSQSRSF